DGDVRLDIEAVAPGEAPATASTRVHFHRAGPIRIRVLRVATQTDQPPTEQEAFDAARKLLLVYPVGELVSQSHHALDMDIHPGIFYFKNYTWNGVSFDLTSEFGRTLFLDDLEDLQEDYDDDETKVYALFKNRPPGPS